MNTETRNNRSNINSTGNNLRNVSWNCKKFNVTVSDILVVVVYVKCLGNS